MLYSLILRLSALALPVLLVTAIMSASAATNVVPTTHIGLEQHAVEINDFKPGDCNSIHVTNLITGSGVITGTGGNDLILASADDDTIYGEGGDDCIVGGAGDDTIYGGDGHDACVGGAGSNTIDPSCEE